MKEYRYFVSFVTQTYQEQWFGYGHRVFSINRKIESNGDLEWVIKNVIKKDCVILNYQLMREIDE